MKECWINVYLGISKINNYHYGQPLVDRDVAERVGNNFSNLIYRIHVKLK